MGKVLEEVDGDEVKVRQVDADVNGQEVVDFALRLVLGGEQLRRDLHLFRGLLDLVQLAWLHVHGYKTYLLIDYRSSTPAFVIEKSAIGDR